MSEFETAAVPFSKSPPDKTVSKKAETQVSWVLLETYDIEFPLSIFSNTEES